MAKVAILRRNQKSTMRRPFAVLLSCASLLAQSTGPATPPSAFHISGTLLQCGKAAPGFWVTFEGESSTTVKVNGRGIYEADLPFGLWTATATVAPPPGKSSDLGMSHPRRFRITASGNLVFNIYLPPPMLCDLMIATPSGQSATPEQQAAVHKACYGEEFFPVPSADGVPFEVDLGGLEESRESCSPTRVNKAAREFATYNALTVEADKVVYNPDARTLEASGSVVIEDESGKHKAHSITFHLEDGRAVPIRKDGLR
jgi:hypothetical protein